MKVKTIRVVAKCSDLCMMDFFNAEGEQIGEYEGYVPLFMPGNDEDYIDLEINVETGEIIDWDVTQKQVDDFFTDKATPVDLKNHE